MRQLAANASAAYTGTPPAVEGAAQAGGTANASAAAAPAASLQDAAAADDGRPGRSTEPHEADGGQALTCPGAHGVARFTFSSALPFL